MSDLNLLRPERLLSVRDTFGIRGDLQVPAFAEAEEPVPALAGAPLR